MSEPNRFSRDDDGDWDEVIIRNPVLVHIERMDGDLIWARVELAGGDYDEIWFEAVGGNLDMRVTGR